MKLLDYKIQKKGQSVQINGNGLFSKDEVSVLVSPKKEIKGIDFIVLKNGKEERINASVKNVTNTTRNTVLSGASESICLIEHFLGVCALLGISGLEVRTNSNELVFGDGSGNHWEQVLKDTGGVSEVLPKYELKEPIFLNGGNKQIAAIPHEGFKVSYYMDWNHPALGQLFASWEYKDGIEKVIRARTFATKQENDFFGMSDILLTLNEKGFNKSLHEPLEPLFHKILDILGDLYLSGINPLEVNMHVIGFKSGHALNIEFAKSLRSFV